jgi:hypothetical protein
MGKTARWAAVIGAAAGALVVVQACDDHAKYLTHEPDTPHQWGTFGEEIYRIVHGAARESREFGPDRAAALEARRDAVIEAADLMLTPPLYQPARDGLAGTLLRIDDGTLPRVTRSLNDLVARLAADRATLDAVIALRDQPWAAGRGQAYDAIRQVAMARTRAGEPVLPPLAAGALRLARAHDGLSDNGLADDGEPRELRELRRALALELAAVDLESGREAHTFDASLLERLVAAVGVSDAAAEPAWVALADPRGLPRVAVDPSTSALYWPFVDADRDGLADATAGGEWTLEPSAEPPPEPYGATGRHATDGRALAYDGRPLYQYANFNTSGAGVVARALRQMALDGTHDDLVHHVDDLMRPRERVVDERDGVSYDAFPADRTRSLEPVFDELWAVIEATREQPPERLLYGADALVREHRGEVRTVLEEALAAADAFEEADHGELAAYNTLLDDLILEDRPPGTVCEGSYDADFNLRCDRPAGPIVPRLIDSGILRDLVGILDDPAFADLAATMADMMTHRDSPVRVSDGALRVPMASTGESADNRSVFQRLLHLVHDTNDAHFSTWVTELINWRIENMAVFYLESYCAEGPELVPPTALAFLDDYFSSTRPSPYEIARFMVVDHSSEFPIYANPEGREGRDLYAYNADTLLAMELSGMNDAFRPLVQVFCDHDALPLLANLLSLLHEHYSTLPEYTTGMTSRFDFYGVERPAGIRTYEASLARAVDGSDLFGAALRAGVALDGTTVDGRPLVDEVIGFVGHLIDRDEAVLLRTHADEPWRDRIYQFDRFTEMAHPTHLNVIYQRAAEAADAWDAEDPDVRGHLTDIFDLVADAALDWPGEEALHRDQAEYMVRTAERALPVLAGWSRENIDRDTWDEQIADAREGVDDLEEQLTDVSQNPLLPAALDAIMLLLDDPETGPLVQELLLYLLAPPEAVAGGEGAIPGGASSPLVAVARLLAAVVQAYPDAIVLERLAAWLATVVDPVSSPLASLPGDLAVLTGADRSSALLLSLANGLAGGVADADGGERPPLVVVAEALAAIGRRDPSVAGRLSADDLVELSAHASTLLDDTDHGLERIYAIVAARAPE